MSTRLVISILVAVILAFGFATPVWAKGPASATLEGPGIEEPIVFFDYNSPTQDFHTNRPAIFDLTALWTTAAIGPEASAPTGDLGPGYTITWIMFGASDEITQEIYLNAAGGPLIHTPGQESLVG